MSNIEQITGALEQVLNISDAEQTSTDTEQTLSDTDPIVTISDTEQVSSDTEETTSGPEQISSGTEKVAGDAEKVAGGAEKVAGGAEKVAGGAEKVAGGAEKVAGGAEKVAGGAEKVAGGAEENSEENSLALVVEDFCLEIYAFVFKEMKYIFPNDGYVINDSEPQTSFSPEFILDVGKAVTFYAITYTDGILHVLKLVQYVVLRRPETLEPFLKGFFELCFKDMEKLPSDKFLVGVLAYCGFICVITDFFLTYTNTMDFAEKCYSNFMDTIISKFEKIRSLGGWEALHEVARPYAALYGCRLAEDNPESNPE